MTTRYSWLLFDADGTILDYNAAEIHSLTTAAASFGYDVTPEILNLYREINSALWADLERGNISSLELRVKRFESLAARLNWTVSAEDFSRIYLEKLGNSGFMINGARGMLDKLPDNMQRAIITNGIKDTQYGRLKQADLMDDFTHIIISEEAGVAKPAAGFFDYALERIGSNLIEEMLIIGDSLSSDIAGGVGYGIDTCWYNPQGLENRTQVKPTYEIADWGGLFSILEV
jgi:2-haloacid dehalogenase